MEGLAGKTAELEGIEIYGRVISVGGRMVEVARPHPCHVGRGAGVIEPGGGRSIACEVVGFSGSHALLTFAGLEGVRRGCRGMIRLRAYRAGLQR